MERHWCLAVGLLFTLFHVVHGLDNCNGWGNAFCGQDQGLTEVPVGIPTDAFNVFLQDNQIRVIEPGAFSNLTKCLKLNLDNNKITELRPGMFDGLISLSELKLSSNAISLIQPGSFLPLQNLFDLWLNGNNISKLDDEFWTGLMALKKVHLDGNRISIPANIPVKVWEISLQDNGIRSIPSGIFSNLTQCQRLNLDNNMITDLRPGIFDGLVSLWELKISNNSIIIIESGTFVPLENLLHLYLNENEIHEVQADMWTGLGSLKRLYLSHNRMKDITTESFVITKDPNEHQDYTLQSLELLDLSYNNITDVQPGVFSALRKLTFLSIAGNKLSKISGDFWTVPQDISYLNLEQNQITVVKKDAFLKLHNVETIILQKNSISSIESGAFYGAVSNSLDLAFNDLGDLRGDMWNGMNSTYGLNLEYNKLTEVRKDMWGDGLDSLDGLHLSYNKITQIHPGAFSPLLRLRDLVLRGNLLTAINRDMWIGVKVLSYLDLGNNHLSDIPRKVLPKLAPESSLYLDKNNLTTLSLNIFDRSKYKRRGGHPRRLYLNIQQNPLHCDSRLCWFKEGQQEGWINRWISPECANYPGVEWVKVDLDCNAESSEIDASGGSGGSGGSGELEGPRDWTLE